MAKSMEEGMMRIGGRKKEEPERKAAEEAGKKKETPNDFEARIEKDLKFLEKERAEEQDEHEQLYALYVFNLHGGQELIDEFGIKKVAQEIENLAGEGSSPNVNMLDLIKRLEPDVKKRGTLYDRLGQRVEERFREQEEREQEGHERRWSSYSYGLDPHSRQGKLAAFGLYKQMDGLAGRLLASRVDREAIRLRSLEPMRNEVLKGNLDDWQKQMSELGADGDLSVLGTQIESRMDQRRDNRYKNAGEVYRRIEGRMWMIRSEINASTDGKIALLLKELGQLKEFQRTAPEIPDLVESKVAAIREEIDELQNEADKEYQERTAGLAELLEKTKSVMNR